MLRIRHYNASLLVDPDACWHDAVTFVIMQLTPGSPFDARERERHHA